MPPRRRPGARSRTAGGDYRWTSTLALEQAEVVKQIAELSLRKEKVPALLWHRERILEGKARVRDRAPPGPATYQRPARGPRREARRTMGKPKGSAVVHRMPGSTRIVVLPHEPTPEDAERARRAGTLAPAA